MIAPKLFKSPLLREAFDHYMKAPNKHSLDQEIALQRTMLVVIMQKVDDNITMHEVAAITTLCDKIANVVEKSSKLNAITPEKITTLFNAVVEILAEYVPKDKLEEVAAKIEAANPLKAQAMVPYVPGEEILINDMKYKIDMAKTDRQKALLEIAQHLEVDGVEVKDVQSTVRQSDSRPNENVGGQGAPESEGDKSDQS